MRRVWLAAGVLAISVGACATGSLIEGGDASDVDSSTPDSSSGGDASKDATSKDVIVPGEAGCPSPTTQCQNICVNTQTDPGHCGNCTTVCTTVDAGDPGDAGVITAVCVGGTCGIECDGGLTQCAEQCFDEQNDPNHCGGCNTSCDGGLCNAGTCCAPGDNTLCSGQCTDTNDDNNHCGNCTTTCTNGKTCQNGSCQVVTTYKVGDYTAYATQGSFTANYLLGEKVVLAQAATLEEFGLISKASGMHVTMALYTDKNGTPNALVASTVSSVVAATDQQFAPSTQAALSAGTYWMMAVYDTLGGPGDDGASTNTIDYISFTYGSALPTTFPAATSYAGQDFNYYLVVE